MKQKRITKKYRLLLIYELAFILVISSAFFLPSLIKSETPKQAFSKVANLKNEQILPNDSSDKTPNEQDKSKDFEIPILMYHYIRVVSDPSDQLGINLSVTPEKFAGQLSYLQEKGYQTITFRDVLADKIPSKPVILSFDDGYEDFFTNAYPELQKHQMTAVSFIITGKSNPQYMTKDQIKTLADAGIEIGSHTVSHPDLSTLNVNRAQNEILASKQELENIIGQKVISFCYPAGKYNDETIDLVKSAGYDFATTTKNGIGKFNTPLTLYRYRMNADTEISTYLK